MNFDNMNSNDTASMIRTINDIMEEVGKRNIGEGHAAPWFLIDVIGEFVSSKHVVNVLEVLASTGWPVAKAALLSEKEGNW